MIEEQYTLHIRIENNLLTVYFISFKNGFFKY